MRATAPGGQRKTPLGWAAFFVSARRFPRVAAAYQPMYCPPLADRLAPVIQLASSGMKNATA